MLKMDSIKDSLITAGQGATGIAISFWSALPDALRVGILIATLIHIIVKIKKDIK
tara:strand:+ start:3175 stop:3339 length:165 start_codon:yes stop_codon:yes gene_type:complete